jgi:dTDP-glucose pyrophosphorylase
MIDWRLSVLPPSASLRRAIETMTGPEASGIVLVCARDGRLDGVVVDSDIRRALLKGARLSAPISKVMNRRPFTLRHDATREAVVRALKAEPRANVPLLDAEGQVRGLARLNDYFAEPGVRPNWVVLLVGGYGTRLGPLTKDKPKPLLRVGDKPILETIVEQFAAQGFRRFAFAVHHKAEQILEHFGNGRRLGVEIRYLREPKKLGTAGPLSLLPRNIKDPIIAMNGDLLTKVDFRALLDFHREEKRAATLCVREYDFQVPFGVVQMDGSRLVSIVEKPVHHFFVSAGIYVLDPSVLTGLKRGAPCDMPDFLERIRRRRPRSISCFPIREYWIDIGRVNEYKRAQIEYSKFF